jgi:hypothetical protein
MAKINVIEFSTGPVYMFIIDDKGRIWRKALEGETWSQVSEIPEEPTN